MVLAAGFACTPKLYANPGNFTVDTLVTFVDALASPFNKVKPGDTIFFVPGNRNYLLIGNFLGSKENPIVFMNKDGVVNIHTEHYFGISIQNCRFVRLTGVEAKQSFMGLKLAVYIMVLELELMI